MGASSCVAAFSDGVVRACARQGARKRDGADEKIVALGAWGMERTGPCQREHTPKRRSCAQPRASACKARNAVTEAQIAALRASHRGDGAGARAVAAKTVAALRRGNGGDDTGARGAGARAV
jgi:hypothetical protein